MVLPGAENRTIVSSFIWTQYRNVTDGQNPYSYVVQRSALRALRTRCKNGCAPPCTHYTCECEVVHVIISSDARTQLPVTLFGSQFWGCFLFRKG